MTASPASAGTPDPRGRSRRTLALVVAVVVVLVAAGVGAAYALRVGPFAPTSPGFQAGDSGALDNGAVVSLVATGNSECTPGVTSYYPSVSAGSVGSDCEFGHGNAQAVVEVPQWLLVPAFSGWSVFGSADRDSVDGYPIEASGDTELPTDCGAGGTPSACPDNPSSIYFGGLENGTLDIFGEPAGVVPLPAHDILINTSTTFPSVEWGSVVVLVFDPDIFPDPSNGSCGWSLHGDFNSSDIANCLTSETALDRALVTPSTRVATFNGGSGGNGLDGFWSYVGMPDVQAMIVGNLAGAPDTQLDSNLYVPYSVEPGAPPSS